MKKILIAFTGSHFSESAFELVRKLNERQPILLTGVFLPQLDFSRLWFFSEPYTGQTFIPEIEQEEQQIQDNIEDFITLCNKYNIKFKVHEDPDLRSVASLVSETRFADLLIICSESFYEYMGTDTTNPSLKETLHYSECPVLVVPEKFSYPNRILLAYDGSPSSVYAIKQFAYLFPEWRDTDTLLVYSNPQSDPELPHNEEIKELAQQHFKKLGVIKLHDTSKVYFNDWASSDKRTLVVSGSFGRKLASQFFRSSFVSEIVTKHQLPVFIAHQ